MMIQIFDLQRFAGEETETAEAQPAAAQENPATILGTGQAPETEAPATPETEAPAKPEGGQEGKTVPETYDFRDVVPEGMEYSETAAKEFSAVAKELGLSQAHASRLASYGMEYMQRGVNAAVDEIRSMWDSWGEQAKTELGKDFDGVISQAAVGRDALERKIPGLRQAFNETGAGNRIEFIRLMAEVGKLVGEDRGGGQPGGAGGDRKIYENTNFDLYR